MAVFVLTILQRVALSNRVSVDSMSNLHRIKVSRVRFACVCVCVWGVYMCVYIVCVRVSFQKLRF